MHLFMIIVALILAAFVGFNIPVLILLAIGIAFLVLDFATQ